MDFFGAFLPRSRFRKFSPVGFKPRTSEGSFANSVSAFEPLHVDRLTGDACRSR